MRRNKTQKYWNGKIAILCQILSMCICFNFFYKMSSGWVLWKTYYTLFLKKCLRPCPCSHPRGYIEVFKFLFVLGSCDDFGSLGCRIGEGSFFYVLCLFPGSVRYSKFWKFRIQDVFSDFLYEFFKSLCCNDIGSQVMLYTSLPTNL